MMMMVSSNTLMLTHPRTTNFILHGAYLVLLVGLDLLVVEFEFLTLEDVTVTATRLTGAGADDGVQTTGGELIVDEGIDLGKSLATRLLLQDAVGLFGVSGSSIAGALLTQNLTVMRFVPLTEGSGIDLDNGALDKGLGTNEFVVGGVVDDVDDAGFAGNGFGAPAEGTGIQTESTEFGVASAGADGVDALLA